MIKKKILNTLNKLQISVILIMVTVGCARMGSLNLNEHIFGKKPKRIIWFQIAGFSEEHLAMLRFNLSNTDHKTSLEDIICLGKIWNFNLYNLRVTPYEGFMSQMTGKKNIVNKCFDFERRPLWSFLAKEGYSIGIFEAGIDDKNSVESAWSCGQKARSFYENLYLWRMSFPQMKEKVRTFHYQEKNDFIGPGIYYDKSCRPEICYSSIYSNVKSIFERIYDQRRPSFFLIRDFSYYKALKEKNILKAKEMLIEIEKSFSYFQEILKRDKEMLLLISSTSAITLGLPNAGKDWALFSSHGKNVVFSKQKLLSTIMAKGAGSENFCGIFEEAEVFKRILWSPEKSKLKFEFLSPF